jgi:WD40-like Beta Propeller Repeat
MLCFSHITKAQFYQGSQNEFGKSRVQYKHFIWQQYRFEKFDTYFYEGGKELADYASRMVVESQIDLEKRFDFLLEDKLQIIVYKTLSDFRQSNIGITGDDQNNIGGTTRIVGSKVFVYFDGDHQNFNKQIKAGIANVLINQMLYGGNWRDVIKNSTLLTLPEWYLQGLIGYAANDFTPEIESKIKQGILSGKFKKFNRLEGDDAKHAGMALWRHIAETKGEKVIPNITYMTRVSRNPESGFLFVLGSSLKSITEEFYASNKQKYEAEQGKEKILTEAVTIKTKKKKAYDQFEASPDGRFSAYTANDMGQYKVYIFDAESKKSKKIFKAENKLNRIVDKSYPVLAWHPTSKILSFIIEKKGRLILKSYNLEDKKITSKEIFLLDKVIDMSYSPDGQKIIFSGVKKGQSDLYLYYLIGNRQEQLTNDIFDDHNPKFIYDGKKIIFSSNRINDTLKTENTFKPFNSNNDIFVYNLAAKSKVLDRITNTVEIDEKQPAQFDSINFVFVANDARNIENLYLAKFDSTISSIDTTIHYSYFSKVSNLTNFTDNILFFENNSKNGRYSLMNFSNGKYNFYTGRDIEKSLSNNPFNPVKIPDSSKEIPAQIKQSIQEITPEKIVIDKNDQSKINIDNYQFQGEKDFTYEKQVVTIVEKDPDDNTQKTGKNKSLQNDSTLSIAPKARNYNINFTTDYVLTQIDNNFGNQFYQPITGPDNLNPGLSGLIKLGVSDLFEDYKILGGFRIAGNLDNNTYLLSFENLENRIDKRYTFQRQSLRGAVEISTANIGLLKVLSHIASYQLKYPFSELLSIRGTINYRNDQYIYLATDNNTLRANNFNDNYAGVKAELVFDNTLNKGINLFNGQRWKLWGEYYKDPVKEKTNFFVLGLDYRNYLKIHRNLIWANRFAASTSFGDQKLLYYLGGVDNWLAPKTDVETPIPNSKDFSFQTLASPMRGFINNTRNGNNFSVINSEIRWPIFKYFFNKPIRSDFVENFQIVGFGDVGAAWTGINPYSDENIFNTQVIDQKPITIRIDNQKEPIIAGYGFGLRSRILGYFVRADYAWGIDDGIRQDPVFYLSLSLDF